MINLRDVDPTPADIELWPNLDFSNRTVLCIREFVENVAPSSSPTAIGEEILDDVRSKTYTRCKEENAMPSTHVPGEYDHVRRSIGPPTIIEVGAARYR